MKLSERLNTVVSFVKPGSRVVDVGTDHGYVPIELAQRGIISHGLAMDVRKGPLERAKEHIRQYGLEDVIETRLSDGICQLQDHEADTVIVAGMGGEDGGSGIRSVTGFCLPSQNLTRYGIIWWNRDLPLSGRRC